MTAPASVPADASAVRGLGYDGPVADTVIDRRLLKAWRALQLEPDLVGLGERAQSDQVLLAACGDVIVDAVLRILRNPDGLTEFDSALDDWREGGKRADATEDLYFTAAEIRRLKNPAAVATPTAGSFKYS